MKLNTSKKWFQTLLALSISFAMVIGIFGGMKLEAKAYDYDYEIDVDDPNFEDKFKERFGSTFFSPDDTLTLCDPSKNIMFVYCYTTDGYDGYGMETIYFNKDGYGTLNFEFLRNHINPNIKINNPQWQFIDIEDKNTIRINFKLVDSSSSDSSDTSPSQPASAPSTPSHECSFQWVTTVEPQPDADGLEEYKCTGCGAVQEQNAIPASVASVQNLCGFVYHAPQNGTVTTDFGRLHTISDYILKKMAERSDVTSIIQFEYKNQKLQIIFPAGTDYSPVLNDDDMMYGFYGIAPRLGLSVTER